MRPQSIVNFERCYLGSVALGLLNSVFNWQNATDQMNASGAATMLGSSILPVTLILGLAINLLLWYFIARRASVVAKWILTVLFVVGLIGIAFALVSGTYPGGLVGILGIVALVLQAVAIWLLFRPDSNRWLDGKGDLGNTFS